MKPPKATLLTLIPILYFSVSGGPYGLEEIVTSVGPLYSLCLILLVPIIWTIPECLIVAELASTYPVQGGYYKWVQAGMGKFWGFMEGWWSILYTLIDLSLYPILFSTYVKIIFPNLDFGSMYLIQLIMIWSCITMNILGIKFVGNVLTFFQSFIVLLFIVFVIIGTKFISFDFTPALTVPDNISSTHLAFGLSLIFWNYIGFDGGSTVLEEIESPEKNFHRALLIIIPIIALLYFFPILVGLAINPDWQSWHFGEFTHIANHMNMPTFGLLLAIGGTVTTFGLFNSLILTSTRIFSVMSKDGWLPKAFAKLHKKHNTPYITIIFAGIIYSFLVLIGFYKLVIYVVFLFLLAMLLEAISLIALRKKNPNAKTRFKIPFGNFGLYLTVTLASLVIIFMAVVHLSSMDKAGVFISLLLVFSGIPVYIAGTKLKLKS